MSLPHEEGHELSLCLSLSVGESSGHFFQVCAQVCVCLLCSCGCLCLLADDTVAALMPTSNL